MVVLGAYLKIKPVVALENVIEGLKKSISERYHHLIPLNEEAINKGMQNIHQYEVSSQMLL
jgi:2-oxoglutarate ferredoxin oxidoreductase subunit gamma